MIKNRLHLFYYFFFFSASLSAQPNNFSGTWQMDYVVNARQAGIHLQLRIAAAEENILYPAQLSLQCGDFSALYDLLLVKKSSRELAISKNKYPVKETPFSLEKQTFFINGILDYSRDIKNVPSFTISRMQVRQPPIPFTDTADTDKANRLTADNLIHFFKDVEIKLTKVNDIPWKDEMCERILSPSLSPAYFGLTDTVYVPVRDGIFNLTGNKKQDIVSLALNGHTILDKFVFNKKTTTDDILLDTGLNTLVMFADNFGNDLPNKGKLDISFAHKKRSLHFTATADSAASFIVTRLYYGHDKEKDITFRSYVYPGPGDKKLGPNEKLAASIIATSQQLTLAIWDDAVEDGDSISININDEWIAKGFPVKKNPQFLTVTLQPGANTIIFIADNLGSIPPNTSVLEIIDGKKRKSFTLATVPGETNLVKIFYEIKPG